MKFKKAGLAIAGILLLILAFFNRKEIDVVKQDTVKISGISDQGIELTSTLHLYNPNLLSSTIKTVQEKFYINGKYIASFNMELSQGIAGLKESAFPVSVRFSREDYLKVAPPDDTINLPITLRIEGELVYQNLINGGTVKIIQEQQVISR